jgi:F0F1-type ATP synthase assembly protein I
MDQGQGITVLSILLAGLGLYGGLGWLLDSWLATKFLLPVGLVLGLVLSVYLIAKKFGQVES